MVSFILLLFNAEWIRVSMDPRVSVDAMGLFPHLLWFSGS